VHHYAFFFFKQVLTWVFLHVLEFFLKGKTGFIPEFSVLVECIPLHVEIERYE
jgi:hypothetical protein